MNNIVDVSVLDIEEPGWLPAIEGFCGKVLDKLQVSGWELSVLFCSDEVIRDLNNRYRGKDEPTDVLSFEQGDSFEGIEAVEGIEGESDFPPVHPAGDIVISLDTLARNSEYFSVNREEELKRLLVHGILHLNGLDHADNSPEQEMLRVQEKMVQELLEVKLF